jgi:nicotinamidase/pyrazinamidase
MRALLVIGMQIDLLPGGPAEVPGSDTLGPAIAALVPSYDRLLAARFQLPANHASFAANHPWRFPGQDITWKGRPLRLSTFFGIPGSFGAEFIPGWPADRLDFIADMGTDPDHAPDHAFRDADGPDTGLADFLRQEGIAHLDICGIPLDTTVHRTALAAQALGLDTTVLTTACAAHAGADPAALLRSLAEQGVTIR